MITGVRGIRSGDEHHPNVFPQIMLVFAHNFPQTASNTIADSCATQASRRDKAHAARAAILHREHAEQDQLPALCIAGLFNPLEFQWKR